MTSAMSNAQLAASTGTGSQGRKRALLLRQRAGGQLEAELLDRFSHTVVLTLAWDGIPCPDKHATGAFPGLKRSILDSLESCRPYISRISTRYPSGSLTNTSRDPPSRTL